MKINGLIVFLMIMHGCSRGPEKTELDILNGYWEIEKVHFPDGRKKEFSLNNTIDHFYIKDMAGSRRKVRPRLQGSFDSANDAEYFIVSQENGSLIMKYTNKLSSWKEKILKIGKNQFSVINEEEITYFYKRFEPHKIQP